MRVRLSRLPAERVAVSRDDGSEPFALDLAELAAYVADHEGGPVRPRWVWDDTARWHALLLDAGVRVARCHDLRLCRRVLRRAPAVDQTLLAGEDAARWDRLGPASASEPALFVADDRAEHLAADAEDERQQRAVAASAEAGRLALLLAAESSGALVAAELRWAGMPWRVDVHEQLLAERLGPRPPRGTRPARLAALAAEVGELLAAPGLNPDSRPELMAALRRQGLDVPDVRAWTLRRLDHPVVEPLIAYKQLAHLLATNGWEWLDAWVRDGRFRAGYQPGGSSTGRWASDGGGALSLPAMVRPAAVADDGWRLVVADVAQLEPRVLAGMSGDTALARAARGGDLYQAMADTGAVETRSDAKLGLLGAMYGATSGESGRLVADLTRRYPRAFGLVEEAARAGERGQPVRTLLGRGSPPIGEESGELWAGDLDAPPADDASLARQDRLRRAYGRFTRNFVVQGTGAEWALCWIADLRNRLWALPSTPGAALTERPHLVAFLHDEVVVHTPAALAEDVEREVRAAAAAAGRLLFGDAPLDFPLSVSVVTSYAEASK
nr:bifunctional 3'-5' exonuclease/DNA polymerase [Nocardioides flavescens]